MGKKLNDASVTNGNGTANGTWLLPIVNPSNGEIYTLTASQLASLLGVGTGQVTETFTPTILFDALNKYSQVTQSGTIAFDLAGSGHLSNAQYTVNIITNGSAITIDETKFFVKGVIDTTQNITLRFYYAQAGVRPTCYIDLTPKFTQLANLSALNLTGGSGQIAATWSAVTGATRYILDYSTDDFATIAHSVTTQATSVTKTGLTAGSWKVRIKADAYGKTPSAAYVTNTATVS